MTFRELASELAQRTVDSEKAKNLDLNIAQASHVVRIMKEILVDMPDAAKVLGVKK